MDQARIKLTLANSNSLNQSDIFVSNAAWQGTPANETVSQCLCEGVQRPKQSRKSLNILRLPQRLRSVSQ